jgi:hypothetical protein
MSSSYYSQVRTDLRELLVLLQYSDIQTMAKAFDGARKASKTCAYCKDLKGAHIDQLIEETTKVPEEARCEIFDAVSALHSCSSTENLHQQLQTAA